MQAKPTYFNGSLYRSKLEAKWAVFFTSLHQICVYEPEAFVCADGSQYTPDFFLPNAYLRSQSNRGVYVEIKPDGWEYDQAYIDRIVSAICEKPFVLLVGEPSQALHYNEMGTDWKNRNEQLLPFWDNYMEIMYCSGCRALKFEFGESNYMNCPLCRKTIDVEALAAAAEKAMLHKFPYVPAAASMYFQDGKNN